MINFLLIWGEQLNILLAILVEGYMQVKSQSDQKQNNGRERSFASEILEILSHEVCRVCKVMWPQSSFLSDEEVLLVLTTQLNDLGGNLGNSRRAVTDYELITFSSNAMTICLDDGVQINRNTLHTLLFGDKSKCNSFPIYSPFSRVHDCSDESSADVFLSKSVTDLLLRFGNIRQAQDMDSATIELLMLDTIKRFTKDRLASLEAQVEITPVLQGEIAGKQVMKEHTAALWINKYKISVVVQMARNLPRMDVFRGADAFCAIFLEGEELLYQTEIKRGRSEKQWNWESEGPFEFEVEETAYSKAISQHKLVAVIYDKDQARYYDL
jgi:hypothetical protein